MAIASQVQHIRNGGTSLVIDHSTTGSSGLPSIIHWGFDLGELSADELKSLATAVIPQRVSGGFDQIPRLSLLPQESFGWQGTPGLIGHRPSSADFCHRFVTKGVQADDSNMVLTAHDKDGGLELRLELKLEESGLLLQQATITNTGSDDFLLSDLALTFPIPASANEILDTYGRHLRERSPQRSDLVVGKHTRESRRGRPGADATVLLVAGSKGFGFERGLVHSVHFAWSGNHSVSVEKGPSYPAFLRVSELLLSGEIVLKPNQSYSTPTAFGSWGDGLNQLSSRYHKYIRARPQHPQSTRPVTVNTWEAVYFDMKLDRLLALADAAAFVGGERFVLDDGWFKGRRDDTAGLGDWFVDKSIWPKGLNPLFDHAHRLGLQCGLWVEPEMVNLNSDLARNHPEWILRPSKARLPVEGRQQHVLDLSNKDAFDYILKCLDDILTEYPLIKYLKWDHNRDLIESGSALDGFRAAVHNNVLAVYRLIDELKTRHPGLEIESCASGGARVDLGILGRTERIWTSDCTDPLERLTIQKYTGLLVPPEILGAHIGAPESHTTGRTHKLDLRAGVPLLGHMGVEWDISRISEEEKAQVAEWIKLHKKWRDVIHTGTVVYADLGVANTDVRGVVAHDKKRAIFTLTQTNTAETYPPGTFHLPGLDQDTKYSVRALLDLSLSKSGSVGQSPLRWATETGPLVLTGKTLGTVGLQIPVLEPERLVVIEVEAA